MAKPQILNAKDFFDRNELEEHIKATFGLTSDSKPDFKISGTEEELARLHLSGDGVVWGIGIIQTDAKQKESPPLMPDRGPKFESGLNKDNPK